MKVAGLGFRRDVTLASLREALLAASLALKETNWLGDQPTIVDFSLAGYVYYPKEETGFDIAAEFPALDAWRKRLAALPGWKPPYELMPVGSDLRTAMRRPV